MADGKGEIPVKEIALKDFLPKAGERFQNSAFLPIAVEIDGDPRVLAHDGMLFTLLLNICRNASVHGQARNVTIKASPGMIEVLDDGKGIAEAVLGKIFELGFSGEKSSGLGLGDAQKRMISIGGNIVCEPHGGLRNKQESHGAKFTLTFAKP